MPNIKISDVRRSDEHELESFILIGRGVDGNLIMLDYTHDATDAISLYKAFERATGEDNYPTVINQAYFEQC